MNMGKKCAVHAMRLGQRRIVRNTVTCVVQVRITFLNIFLYPLSMIFIIVIVLLGLRVSSNIENALENNYIIERLIT